MIAQRKLNKLLLATLFVVEFQDVINALQYTYQMIRLTEALSSWGSEEFEAVLKREIEQIDAKLLPLQEGLSASSYAMDDDIQVMIIGVAEEVDVIRVKAGIFYSGIIAGCSCADDPTPVDKENEYCEVELVIEKSSARTRISILTPG